MSELNQHNDPTLDIIRYISGEMSNDERLRFQAWLSENQEHQASYDQLLETWTLADRAADILDVNPTAAWNKLDTELFGATPVIDLARPVKTKFNWKVLAAVIVLLLTTTTFILLQPELTKVETTAAIHQTTLPDGSAIDLAKHSSIVYDQSFGDQQRHVKLKGKAVFEVAHDEQKPFVVDAGPVLITVLGTNFLVEAENALDSVAVIVNRGKVSVKDKATGNEVIITAGERAVFVPSTQALTKMVNTEENYLSWKTKIFKFGGTKLKRVVRRLNDAHDTQVIIGDEILENCTVNTTLKADQSLEEIIEVIIAINEGIMVEKANGQYVLSGSGCFE